MKIAIVGIGYVGLSLATLLSQRNEVIALDILSEKVEKINNRNSPIKDNEVKEFFENKKLKLKATVDYIEAFEDAKYIIICTPTNYDDKKGGFDVSSVEKTIKKVISVNKNATIVIKSTVPIGFTNFMKEKYKIKNIFFSPEFLREGHALYDNLYPSRIIIGDSTEKGKLFANLLKEATLKEDVQVLFMGSTEAEAVKLFSNTYLALRVAYFNELDTYAETRGLNTKDIIDGVCSDSRIGSHYNNPSFGFGGYCLPKDTKQLKANYKDVPENLITAIVESNRTRKAYIAQTIIDKKPKVVGIHRLTMKSGSDNFRESAVLDIINLLKRNKVDILIYEPLVKEMKFKDCEVVKNLDLFCEKSNIIIANRWDDELNKYKEKIYIRDIYGKG